MKKIFFWLLSFWAGWWNFNQYLWKLARGKLFSDRKQFAHFMEILSPAMHLEFKRLFEGKNFDWEKHRAAGYQGKPGDFNHNLKNVLVESFKNNAEIMAKFAAWAICWLFIIAIIGWSV